MECAAHADRLAHQTVEVDEAVRAVHRVERGERRDRAVHAERVHSQRESAARHCGQMRQRATEHQLPNNKTKNTST